MHAGHLVPIWHVFMLFLLFGQNQTGKMVVFREWTGI